MLGKCIMDSSQHPLFMFKIAFADNNVMPFYANFMKYFQKKGMKENLIAVDFQKLEWR